MADTILSGRLLLAHQAISKFVEHNIDMVVELVANARLELVYLGTFIRRSNVLLKLTVNFLIEFWSE